MTGEKFHPFIIFKGVPNGRVVRELRQADYSRKVWRRKVLTLGDNITMKIKSRKSVMGKYLGGYERVLAAAAKPFTITAHRTEMQEWKKR